MKSFVLLISEFSFWFLYLFRRQSERNKLAREKQLRETAEREKAALEQQLIHFQEEFRVANEQLVLFSVLNSFILAPSILLHQSTYRGVPKSRLSCWPKRHELQKKSQCY